MRVPPANMPLLYSGVKGLLQIEINLAMPSCDGYAGRYMLADGSIPCGFGQAQPVAAQHRQRPPIASDRLQRLHHRPYPHGVVGLM